MQISKLSPSQFSGTQISLSLSTFTRSTGKVRWVHAHLDVICIRVILGSLELPRPPTRKPPGLGNSPLPALPTEEERDAEGGTEGSLAMWSLPPEFSTAVLGLLSSGPEDFPVCVLKVPEKPTHQRACKRLCPSKTIFKNRVKVLSPVPQNGTLFRNRVFRVNQVKIGQ